MVIRVVSFKDCMELEYQRLIVVQTNSILFSQTNWEEVIPYSVNLTSNTLFIPKVNSYL